jgi:hypothetical protein
LNWDAILVQDRDQLGALTAPSGLRIHDYRYKHDTK